MIKFLAVIFVFFLTNLSLFAQVEPPSQRVETGGFGAFNTYITTLNNKTTLYTGGGGGFVIKNFRLGAFFSGLTNSYSEKDTDNEIFKLGLSYGGLWFAYPLYLNRDYHPVFDLKFHYGSMRFINTNWKVKDKANFYGFSTSLGLEYKLNEIFFIAGGIKYKYSFFIKDLEFESELFDEDYFHSIGIYISLRLGSF